METSLANDLMNLRLFYLLENFDSFIRSAEGESAADLLRKMVTLELVERNRRSVERRLDDTRLGRFKRMEHFDWNWPKQYDRECKRSLKAIWLKGLKTLLFSDPEVSGRL